MHDYTSSPKAAQQEKFIPISALDCLLGRCVDPETLAANDYITDAPWGDGEAEDPNEDDGWAFLAMMEEIQQQEDDYPTRGEALRLWHKERALGPCDPLPNLDGTYSKRPITMALRWEVFRRDGYSCVYCDGRTDLTADHIISERRGGDTALWNLQTLCRPCNSRKGAR